jgi:acyl carrier protein
MAANWGSRDCELVNERIAGRADVGAVTDYLLDGHRPSGASVDPAPELLVSTEAHDRHQDRFSLGGSMVGGAVPTAAAPPAVAHLPANDRLETRGSTAPWLAERRDELLPEVAPAQLSPRGKGPGRTSRPQAVPPRPGVRDHVCPRRRDPEAVLTTIRRLVAEIAGTEARVTRTTSFDADLGLESDQLVTLGRRLFEAYGPDVDVPAWFGELDIDDLVALTAGDVTDFVVWCLD